MPTTSKRKHIACGGKQERAAHTRGFRLVAGVDEVGRGALFGPVFAAAVILSPTAEIRGLRDSKELEPARREVLAARIQQRAIACAINTQAHLFLIVP